MLSLSLSPHTSHRGVCEMFNTQPQETRGEGFSKSVLHDDVAASVVLRQCSAFYLCLRHAFVHVVVARRFGF